MITKAYAITDRYDVSNDALATDTSETTASGDTDYHLASEFIIKVKIYSSTRFRLTYTIKTNATGTTYGQITLNGTVLNTQSTISDGYQTMTYNLTTNLRKDDVIQFYVKNSEGAGAGIGYMKDATVKGIISPVALTP